MCNKFFVPFIYALFPIIFACSDETLGGGSSIDPNANPSTYATNSSSSGLNPKDLTSMIVFETEITQTILIENKEIKNENSVIGKIDVHAEENGASAECEVDEMSYIAKFKLKQYNQIAQSLDLKNYGSSCDSVLDVFKKSCMLKSEKDLFSGACKENGKLTATCVYMDENAIFGEILENFISISKKNCLSSPLSNQQN